MLKAAANQGGAGLLLLRRKLHQLVEPEEANALLTTDAGALAAKV